MIGESINRKIQLANKGALGTNFKILTLKEFKKETENTNVNTKELTNDSGGLVVSGNVDFKMPTNSQYIILIFFKF